MKHLVKRTFVLLLSASIAFSSVPVQNVYAEEGEPIVTDGELGELPDDDTLEETPEADVPVLIDDYEVEPVSSTNLWYGNETSTTIELTSYNGEDGSEVELVIPDTCNGKTVTALSSQLFKDQSFKSVTLPTSLIQNSYSSMFIGCGEIGKVIVPSGYTDVGKWFAGVGQIKSIEFQGDTVTTIPYGAFSGSSSIEIITGLSSVKYVGEVAFSGCSSLESIEFSDKLTNIGRAAFQNASALTTANLGGAITTLPNSIFLNCANLETVTGVENVTKVEGKAFSSCAKLGNVILSSDLERLGESAFLGTAITFFELPGSLAGNIGNGVFSDCSKLEDVTVADGITAIPMNMFSQCTSLDSIYLPDSITEIGDSAFQGCTALEYINFPDTIKTFGNLFLSDCSSIADLTLPGSLGVVKFMSGCKGLKNVTLKDGIYEIGSSCFYGVQLNTIKIPATVATIGSNAIGWYDTETHSYRYPIIYGYTGSYAQRWAEENGITFESIGDGPGVYLSGSDVYEAPGEAPVVYRGLSEVSVQAVLGSGETLTDWEFKHIAPDQIGTGEGTLVGEEHYILDTETNELIIKDTSDFDTTGVYQITAYCKSAVGALVTYIAEFSFKDVQIELWTERGALYDGSEIEVGVSTNYEPDGVTYCWEAGLYNVNGEFEKKLKLQTENNSYILKTEELISVWGENPEDGAKACIRVTMLSGTKEIDESQTEIAYSQDVFKFPYVDELVSLKGSNYYLSENDAVYVQNAEYPDGTLLDIKITNIESDTLNIPYDEDDGDYYFSYENATANSGTVKFTYKMYADENSTEVAETYIYEAPYEFVDCKYNLYTVETGMGSYLVKGQKKTITPMLSKETAVEDEDGEFDIEYKENVNIISPLSAEWIYDETLAGKYVKFTKNSDGSLGVEVINGVDGDVSIQLKLVIKDGAKVVATEETYIDLTPAYNNIIFYDIATGKTFEGENLKLGESKTIRPAVMNYTDASPNGTDLEIEVSLSSEYDEGIEVIDHEDGTYTIKRISENWISLYFEGKLPGEDETIVGRNLELDWLDFDVEFFANEDEDDFVLFTDNKIKITAVTNQVGTDVVWDWDFVASGDDYEDEIYRIDITKGKDLRSIELDGSEYAAYLANDEIQNFRVEVNLYSNDKFLADEWQYLEYQEPVIPMYIEGVVEDLVNETFEMEETYEGYLRTKEYPNGKYANFTIRDLKVLSGNDVVSIEKEGNTYLLKILKEGTAVISYDIYHYDQMVKEDVTFEVKGVMARYSGQLISSSGKEWILKNETLTLIPEYYLDCYSEEGYKYKEEIEDVKLDLVFAEIDCWEDECEGECRIDENANGTVTFAPNNHECRVELKLDVYAGNVKIDSYETTIYAAESRDDIYFNLEAELKALKAGETVTVTPECRRFNVENPDGTVMNGKMSYPLWEYDSNDFEITDHKDGSYTIKRLNPGSTSLTFTYLVFEDDLTDFWCTWYYDFSCEHINTRKINGKDATCLEAGYSGAIVCDDCEYLVSTSSAIDKLPHAMTYHEAKEATCEAVGNVEYWSCATCGKNYDKAADGNVITDVVVVKKPHEMTYHGAKEATCEASGTVEYWSCAACGKNYDKEADGNIIEDVVAAKKPHEMTYYEAKEATCEAAGNVEYWSCATCGKNYDAAADGNVITDVVVVKKPHEMTYHGAKEATCEAAGNVEYWSCAACGKNYDKEADGNVLETVVIAALGHKLTLVEKVNPTYEIEGSKVHYKCTGDEVRIGCGKLFWDDKATSEAAKEELVVAKLVYVAPEVKEEVFEEETKVTVETIIKEIKEGNLEHLPDIDEAIAEQITEAVNAGYDIVVEVVTDKVADDEVESSFVEIETQIAEKAEANELHFDADQIEFKQIADISMMLVKVPEVETETEKRETVAELTELEKPVTLSFTDVEAAPEGMKYVVIRLHENADGTLTVDILETKQDGRTVSFTTDKFSLYTLALVPEEAPSDPDDGSGTGSNSGSSSGSSSSGSSGSSSSGSSGHHCVFDQEVATDVYLNTPATTTKRATYFKSCVCTGKGTEIFEYGELLKATTVKEETSETILEEVKEVEENVTEEEKVESETTVQEEEKVADITVEVTEGKTSNTGIVVITVAIVAVIASIVLILAKKRKES